MTAQNVVIVGAPRSGTNMLRDALTSLPGVATWPCDEINLIWRHGNRAFPSDELPRELARPEVVSYIRRRFERVRARYRAHTVVEKTCATSLRVDFARECLPNAKYLFITRDGLDAAASAMSRWNADFDVPYTARKARFVPLADVPYYATRFMTARAFGQRRGPQALENWWGPRPHDYKDLMHKSALDEACAIQWQRCVEQAMSGLSGMTGSQLLHVGYEDFVRSPGAHMSKIVDFLGLPTHSVDAAVQRVSPRSVGKGRAALGPDRVARLESIIGGTLAKLGYAG